MTYDQFESAARPAGELLLIDAGDEIAAILEDAISVHIYDDDEEPDDCPERQAIAAWERAKARAPMTDEQRAALALRLLIEARELVKAAGNKRTLERVRLAISSAKGARRIQTGRRVRAEIEAARPRDGSCRRNGHHHGPCSNRCNPAIPPRA